MIGNLLNLFDSEEKRNTRALALFGQGKVECAKCRSVIPFDPVYGMSLQRCPKCTEVFFVPLALNGWVVVRPLASGGFASIYLAISEDDPTRVCAVKVLREDDPAAGGLTIDQFLREGEAMEAIGPHPGIPKLIDYGDVEGQGVTVIMMEYLPGTSIDHMVRPEERKLPIEEALFYNLDVAEALHHIHSRGFLFRDVKPENILVLPDGHAKLTDFGLCIKGTQCRAGKDAMGTARYLPPERVTGGIEDCRGDIYSLGMTLYYMLQGEWYVTGDSEVSLLKAHARRIRLRTADKMVGFPADVVELVDQMIRRNPQERIPNCGLVIEQTRKVLQHLAEGPPVNDMVKRRRREMKGR